MKRFSTLIMSLFISFALHPGGPTQPGTRVWDNAVTDLDKTITIESQVDVLGNDINIDFNGTFTALDDLLAKICTVQSQAEQLALSVNTLEVNFGNDASKICAIDSKVDALLVDVQAIDTQSTFTALEDLQQTLCSKIEQLNTELAHIETEITNITQTEIDHDQNILSKLNIIDTNVTTINSILDNITFDASLTTIDSLLDVINMCVATVDSKLDQLENTIEANFAGTFTALDANLQKACTIESLADEIPMSFMADLTGVYTALNELEQTMCTIDSKVDNLDMSVMTIESDVDILNSTIDQTLSKLCILESKTDVASCSQCFSLMENIGTNMSNDCSILDILNDNELLAKACSIDSNIDVIINTLPTQNSKLEVISSETDIVESKVCDIEMNSVALSKLCAIDSKLDITQETTLTVASLVNVIDQTSQTIESKICNVSDDNILSKLDLILPETETICSNLDELILTLSTVDSKLDTILATNAGQLCTDFGNTGTVTTSFGPGSTDNAHDVAIQTDGKIVVVGQTSAVSGLDFALARYLANGSLDVSFGVGGLVTTDISTLGVDNALGVAIQTDGKIVVAGQTTLAGTTSIALVRYNIDGSLDTTFNGTGIVITPPIGANTVALANAIHIQADGKIVIAGGTGIAAATDFLLARYNIDGSLDATFGVAGIATIDLGDIDVAHALLIQADGRIVAVGVSGASFAVVRLTTAGILDTTFGGGSGIVITSIGTLAVANAALLQVDGKIIVAGYSDLLGSNNFALTRYNIDGSLDTSFGLLGTGIVVQSFAGVSITLANAALLQADGKIILIGSNDIGGAFSFSLSRFNSNGTIDTSFGINGQVTTTFSAGVSVDIARAAALTSDDQLIAIGGTNESGSFDFALACYELDTSSIFLIEQKTNAICTQLELLPTSTLNSKLDNIELFACTIESNMDVAGNLVDSSITKAINLEDDLTSTWTTLDVIENKLCASESILETVNSNLAPLVSSIDELNKNFVGTFTVIKAIEQKTCTVDSKIDQAATAASVNLSGVFTALDALESKICLIEDITSNIDQGITEIIDALGTPIYQSDVGTTGYTISTPGRYYLAENIVFSPGVASSVAITISTDNVFLDLNNKSLQQGNATATVKAIFVSADGENIGIANGFILDFTGNAIALDTNTSNMLLRDISMNRCGSPAQPNAIDVQTVVDILMDNITMANGVFGMTMVNPTNAVLKKCLAISNEGDGIAFQEGFNVLLQDCAALNQLERVGDPGVGHGFDIQIGDNENYVFERCKSEQNFRLGFKIPGNGDTTTGLIIKDSISNNNTQQGINITNSTEGIILNNTCIGNTLQGVLIDNFIAATGNNYIAFNTCMENSINYDENSFIGANTFLGNFALNSSASGSPNNTNYDISGGSNISGKFVTIAQNGAFPATEPTEWHNINMLP